ncbi:MAG: OmpA family protein [Muribaculaceae bacterium]|nr:OmpA family protein [Muribaculaceae bacterium]
MKKSFIVAAFVAAVGAFSANSQVIEAPKFFDNWSIGLDGGVATPIAHQPFFGSMRGVVGLHFGKQLTPVFGTGIEGSINFNTSSWKYRLPSATAIDESYVGLYGTADLFNLFGGFNCAVRPFTIDAVVGAGWGRYYFPKNVRSCQNNFYTKAGLNFNFNVSNHVTVALKPFVIWNMENKGNVAYHRHQAALNILAGVSYKFGKGFTCVRPYDQAEVDALNNQINSLHESYRAQLDAALAKANELELKANGLANELEICKNRKPEVVKEVSVNTMLNSVRFVFFRVGSKVVAADQMPNVEMIADYLKSHPDYRVVVKGYASKDGNYDSNVKLAAARAEAVKNALVSKYKISAKRIIAEGQGIGDMFEEDSWNRVSICTLEPEK